MGRKINLRTHAEPPVLCKVDMFLSRGAQTASEHNRSYVSSVGLPSDSLCKNLAWWAVTRRTLRNQKIGGGRLPRTIQYYTHRKHVGSPLNMGTSILMTHNVHFRGGSLYDYHDRGYGISSNYFLPSWIIIVKVYGQVILCASVLKPLIICQLKFSGGQSQLMLESCIGKL